MQEIEVIELERSEFEPYREQIHVLLKDFDSEKDQTAHVDAQLEKIKLLDQVSIYLFHIKGVPVGMYVGTVKPTPFNTSLCVDSLVTKREYRGRGIGTHMIEHMKSVAIAKECKLIELTSSKGAAQKMYVKSGFSEVTGFRFEA